MSAACTCRRRPSSPVPRPVDERLGENGPVRSEASILHLDLDAFFAAVEQRDKPSLRGRPVIVGGVGPRGVVATASYEARLFGVRSAMSTAEARSRCPHAAFLSGRFDAYRATSDAVMARLRALSPLVEPLSLDEAYVDLAAAPAAPDLSPDGLVDIATRLKRAVYEATGGLTASVGIASSKLVAKIASELDKPDGTVVVAPGTEQALLRPMPVTVIPGVGPATAERLRRIGVHTVRELEAVGADELVRVLGKAHGANLFELSKARDDRAVVSDRETKSISVEDTFETDLADPVLLAAIVDRHARGVCERLRKARLSGRTVTLKVRMHDFATLTRSATLAGPTDRPVSVSRTARALLAELDTTAGVRLLGVGVSGLADWIQDDLFAEDDDSTDADEQLRAEADESGDGTAADLAMRYSRTWAPGMDVEHAEIGPGWVWGSGIGRVTVRFETAETGPGPIRTFAADDPALQRRSVAAGTAH
jgi:DNA polymerase IV